MALREYMTMTEEELSTTLVRRGDLNYLTLYCVLFPEEIHGVTLEDIKLLEKVCNDRFGQGESDSHEEELLRLLYGIRLCTMSDIESENGYLFSTPLSVMQMDLNHTYEVLRELYRAAK